MRIRFDRYAALLLVLAAPAAASAGPWTKGPGEHYAKLSGLFFRSDTFVAPDGSRQQGADYAALSAALYAELGLLEGLHLQAFVPYAWTRNRDDLSGDRFATIGSGDAILGAQWAPPIAQAVPWAVRLEAKAPLYDVGAIGGPLAAEFPALGDGQLDVTGWASVGGSLYPLPIWGFVEAGWRRRTEVYYGEGSGRAFADGAVARGQLGMFFFDERAFVTATADAVYTPTDDAITMSFVTLSPGFGARLGRGLWLEGGAIPMVWSRNNAPGTTWTLGVSHKR